MYCISALLEASQYINTRRRRDVGARLAFRSVNGAIMRDSLFSSRSLWSILSFASVLSIASSASLLSIGSFASILSIGSSGSVLSIGSSNAFLAVGRAGRRRRLTQGVAA
jgi:hypothetical protein